MAAHKICFYTLYCKPSDYPGKYVVKKWIISGVAHLYQDADFKIVVDTMDECKEALRDIEKERGYPFYFIPRSVEDDSVIIGTYI